MLSSYYYPELKERMDQIKANIGKVDAVTLNRLINREIARLGIDTRNWVDKTVVSDSSPKKKVGMFYYAEDKSFSEQLLPNKQVSGVVGYVDETGQHGLIVTLYQYRYQWADEYTHDADDYYVPQGATSKQRTSIVWYVFQQGLKIDIEKYLQYCKRNECASVWDVPSVTIIDKEAGINDIKNSHDDSSVICYNYSKDGIRQGEAFLGNKEEMSLVCQNRYQINQALSLIPHAELLHPSYYWTGTLDPDNRRADYRLHAWALALNFNNGMSYSCNIEYYAYILPLLEF